MVSFGRTLKNDELPNDEYELLPEGEYIAIITESEEKENNAKTGSYIQLSIEIQDGKYAGRKLTERLNIKNQNDTAVNIAFATIKKINTALGLDEVENSTQWHNKRFIAKVGVQKGKPYTKDGLEVQGNDQNVIKKYLPYGNKSSEENKQSGAFAGGSQAPWKQ